MRPYALPSDGSPFSSGGDVRVSRAAWRASRRARASKALDVLSPAILDNDALLKLRLLAIARVLEPVCLRAIFAMLDLSINFPVSNGAREFKIYLDQNIRGKLSGIYRVRT